MQKKNKTNNRKPKNKSILVMSFIAIIIPLMASTCGEPLPETSDFSVSANSLAVTQGESGTSIVTVSSSDGFSDMVSLRLQGAPVTVTSSFSSIY